LTFGTRNAIVAAAIAYRQMKYWFFAKDEVNKSIISNPCS